MNRFNKRRDRALLLTDQHLYKLEPSRQYRVMRAVPLDAVSLCAPALLPTWEVRNFLEQPQLRMAAPPTARLPLPALFSDLPGGPSPHTCGSPHPHHVYPGPPPGSVAHLPGTADPVPKGQKAPWGRGPGPGPMAVQGGRGIWPVPKTPAATCVKWKGQKTKVSSAVPRRCSGVPHPQAGAREHSVAGGGRGAGGTDSGAGAQGREEDRKSVV